MPARRVLIAFLALLTFYVQAAFAPHQFAGASPQADPIIDWIRSHAVALKTTAAGNGFDDMRPLKELIGQSRIVSLGEATHGSSEFFKLKHRMLEFLASEMGFNIFSIEANLPEAYRLNHYVVEGKGDPAQLLRGMYFWTWDTEEVLAMIRWMREFNKSGKGRVQFTGFDMQVPDVAVSIVGDFASRYDASFVTEVDDARRMSETSTAIAAASFGLATGTFPVSRAAGKKVRYSGYIKTEGVTSGYAGLWWRVDGPAGVLAFDNMQSRGVKGTTGWTRYTIELPVDASAKNINFGAILPGNGTAWFDALTIELDGEPFTDASLFDLDFEAESPVGFLTGGAGYREVIDTAVAQSGKESLRMQSIGAPQSNTTPTTSPTAAAERWKGIVSHLDGGRAAYRTAGASERDIEWAVQNARVVLQAMQLRAGKLSRDQSMADNIKWILDQNPGAKMVVWAHNGHVATGGFSYETMGSALRRMYGREMVVFGFSFNQGSFQAIEQGRLVLQPFTVPPAPSGSLDATLAAAGLPLFALDLRVAPEWFRQARGSRQIGAVYPEGAPYASMSNIVPAEVYDAVLFVESTTVARKNPGR
jgi:erythromycin esterase-like protein